MGVRDIIDVVRWVGGSRWGQHLRQPASPEWVALYACTTLCAGFVGGVVSVREREAEPAWAARERAQEVAAAQTRRGDSLQTLAAFAQRDAGARAGLADSWHSVATTAQAQSAACSASLRGWQEIHRLEVERASALRTSDALLIPGYYGNPLNGVTPANVARAGNFRSHGAEISAEITTLSARLPM